MKIILPFIVLIVLIYSCSNNSSNKKAESNKAENDSIQIVNNYFKNDPNKIEFEIPILKGTKLRHGLQKRFYNDGNLYSTIPYTRNERNGIAYTYYKALKGGKPAVWKEQSYENGKLNGICKRYHKDGILQAEYMYRKGFRKLGIKEYSQSGKEIKQPELILNKTTNNSVLKIKAKMSNGTKNVKYYSGNLVEKEYVSTNIKEIKSSKGIGEFSIQVPSNKKSISIIAVTTSKYYNMNYISKTISLQ